MRVEQKIGSMCALTRVKEDWCKEITIRLSWWTCGAELLRRLRSLATISIMLKRKKINNFSAKTLQEKRIHIFSGKNPLQPAVRDEALKLKLPT